MSDQPALFCFGLGFSATALAHRLAAQGWRVAGTSQQAVPEAPNDSAKRFSFRRDVPLSAEGRAALAAATHVLVSVPPDFRGDPVLSFGRPLFAESVRLSWIGYLSSTGVYGDTGGAPVDEHGLVRPTSLRAEWRAAAERDWLEFGAESAIAVHIFRLAGIYGPGRSAFDRLREGRAQRISRPGHRFSRIHVEDIASVLHASITRPCTGMYNVADDEPAEPERVIAFAAELLGMPLPPLVSYEEAAQSMSPMALSFWRDNRIVVSRHIRERLDVRLAYPTFREGLKAILASESSGT
jgi:nucleoside-diphosphate-sugar epimerase